MVSRAGLQMDEGKDVTTDFDLLVIGGGSLVALTWELRQYSAVLGLPMAFVYSVIPLAGVLICLYAIAGATGVELAQADDPSETEE